MSYKMAQKYFFIISIKKLFLHFKDFFTGKLVI